MPGRTRRASDVFYALNGAQILPRGGARRIQIIATNIDAVSNTFSIYGLQFLPYHYPDLLFSDSFTYVHQNIGGTVGTIAGFSGYTAIGQGAQLYSNASPEYAGEYLHDLTTWSLECFFQTGASLASNPLFWADYSVYPSTVALSLQIVGGVLKLNSIAGTNTGPFVTTNTIYHLIVTFNGTVVTWFLNGVASNGTGTIPTAQPVGTIPAHQMFAPSAGWQIGFLTLWRGVALTAQQQANHYNFMWHGYVLALIDTQTVAAGTSYKAILGEYGTLPLPERSDIAWGGNFVVTVEYS